MSSRDECAAGSPAVAAAATREGWGGVSTCEVWWERSELCALACMVSVYYQSQGVRRCPLTQTRRDQAWLLSWPGCLCMEKEL